MASGWDPAAEQVHGSALGSWVSKTFTTWFLPSFLEISGPRASWISAANRGLCPSLSQPHVFENNWETPFWIRRAKNLILQTTSDLVTKFCQYPKKQKITDQDLNEVAEIPVTAQTSLLGYMPDSSWLSSGSPYTSHLCTQSQVRQCYLDPGFPHGLLTWARYHQTCTLMVRRHQENTQGHSKYSKKFWRNFHPHQKFFQYQKLP